MFTDAALKPILTKGRVIEGIYKDFVCTKSKDGFSRLYRIVDDKPIFIRASRTKVKTDENGDKIILRNKYAVTNGYQEIEGEFNDTVRTIDTFIKRNYNSNGERESASINEYSYDFWEHSMDKKRTEERPQNFIFPEKMSEVDGFVGGKWTKLNKDYTGKMEMENPVQDADGTRLEGYISTFSMYPASIYGDQNKVWREINSIYLDNFDHEHNRIHFREAEKML